MIYITGDTHGRLDLDKLSLDRWPEQILLSRKDFLVILGDFGGIWGGTRADAPILDFHNLKPYTTLFIDGNHENFDALERLPVEDWNGGRVRRIRPNILHLTRGQVFEIDGLKIFTFGGAASVDREYRQEFVSWWRQEIPSQYEINKAMENLAKQGNKVDVILTHTAPSHICKKIVTDVIDDPTSQALDKVYKRVKFSKWYFGHWHVDTVIGRRFRCFFNDVMRL